MTVDITLDQLVAFAVQTEELGQRVYTRLARRFADDPELGKLFETFAKDEEHHAAKFAGLKDKVGQRGPLGEQEQLYLRAVSISEVFSGEDAIGKNIDQVQTREDALAQAFKLEKATLHYYQALKEVLKDDALDEFIAEEKSHLTKVMQYMVTGAQLRGLGDKY